MAFPENSQKALLAKHASAERVTQVRIISRDGDVFEFEGVLPQPVTAVIVAAAFKLPYTASVKEEKPGDLLCGRDGFCCELHGSNDCRGCECWCHDIESARVVRSAIVGGRFDPFAETRRLIEKAARGYEELARKHPNGRNDPNGSQDELKAETLRRFAEVFLPPVPGGADCKHPRASWYGDREHGTTFCGVCHKQVEDAVVAAARST